jgi:hypothetical protein
MAPRKISCAVRAWNRRPSAPRRKRWSEPQPARCPSCARCRERERTFCFSPVRAARRLAYLPDPIGRPLTQKIVYAISGAALSECDIATLTERGEDEVPDELVRF